MFGDCIFYHFTVHGYCVKLDFFCSLQELGYDNRIFFGYFCSQSQEFDHLFFVVTNIHGSTGKYIGRTNQDRESYLFDETVDLFHTRQFCPCRLVDIQCIEHC